MHRCYAMFCEALESGPSVAERYQDKETLAPMVQSLKAIRQAARDDG